MKSLTLLLVRYELAPHNRQGDLRRVLSRMMNRVVRRDPLDFVIVLAAGVQFQVEARKAARKRGHPLFFASLMGVHVLHSSTPRTIKEPSLGRSRGTGST